MAVRCGRSLVLIIFMLLSSYHMPIAALPLSMGQSSQQDNWESDSMDIDWVWPARCFLFGATLKVTMTGCTCSLGGSTGHHLPGGPHLVQPPTVVPCVILSVWSQISHPSEPFLLWHFVNLGREREGCGSVDTLEWPLFLGRAPGMINFMCQFDGT